MEEQKIPEGYKQTEVGVIPDDWECGLLKEFATFGGGTTPPRSAYERYYSNGSHPWVKTLDLNNSIINVTEEKITSLALSEVSIVKHPKGTVLVAMYGGFNQIGRTGLLAEDSAINQALVAIRPQHRLSSNYLLFNLNYNVEYWKLVASSSRKDPNITSNDVKNYPLCLPPVEEQNAIANVLSDVDALIAGLEKLIAKKQAIKTATMQQLLTGRTRLPEFANHPDGTTKGYKQTELGEIPEDWEIHSLSKICDVRDGTHDSPKYRDNGVPLVTSKNIVDDILDLRNVSLISLEDAFEIDKRSKVDKGDIIMSMIGTIGSAVLLTDDPKFCIKNVALFKPKGVFGEYFIHFIRSSFFQDCLEDSMDGGIQKFVSLGTLRNMKIVLPIRKEQTAIANILSDMDEEIQSLQQRLDKTRQIKQGMMQELLTGKTRLI
ncbi:MAG TPA: restriction endonuclease subunit S [Alteromonas macleodii]|mgnify:CR=1 FL=1|nr:restriction endonuclease subunit S [Alteromonas macleodii]MBS46676.1 hypothetical protein [Sphingobium sp.]HCC42783.1 restriction endonuclease subunit S [Gammaproteobacteria bacterium]HCS82311.1 restriction endonuclease subunit S [Alteromonas macleodii]|tara:strand:- start:121 stop:1419 length:1299 start_codon:yes stop_codon:yes gene_type:complete